MLSAECGSKTSAAESFQDERGDEECDGSAGEDIARVVGLEDDAGGGDGDDEEDHEPFQPRVEPPERETKCGGAGGVAAGEGPEIGSAFEPEEPGGAKFEAGGRRGRREGIGAEGTGHEGGIGQDGAGATEGHLEDVGAGGDGEDGDDDGENAATMMRIEEEDEDAAEGDGEGIAELLCGFESAADVASEGDGFGPGVNVAVDGPGGKAAGQEDDASNEEGSRVASRGDRTIVRRRCRRGRCWIGDGHRRVSDEQAQTIRPLDALPSPAELVSTRWWRAWFQKASSSWQGGFALLVLCLCTFLPGLTTIPPVDRDEARFAQASRQMVESGTVEGWVVPRVQERARLNKPPLIYWLQAGCVKVAEAVGVEKAADWIWLYRVPSLLAGIIAVLATWRLGLRMFEARAAWLAAALLAVCPVMVWEVRQARADMVLLAATTVAMGALFSIWHADHESKVARLKLKQSRVLFWGAMTVAVMVKGPIAPMIATLTLGALALMRRKRGVMGRLGLVPGMVCVVVSIGVWVGLVANEVGWETYFKTIYDETIGRSMSPKEGHAGPPGYHLLLASALFWPGSLLTGLALVRTWQHGMGPTESRAESGLSDEPRPDVSWFERMWGAIKRRLQHGAQGRQAELYLLAWTIPAWLFFEFAVATKLPHYTMPLYPALALMNGRAVFTATFGAMATVTTLMSRVGYVVWSVLGMAISLAPVGIWWKVNNETGIVEFAIALLPAVCMLIAVTIAWKSIFRGIRHGANRGQFISAQFASVAGAVVLAAVLCGMVLPNTPRLWVSKFVSQQVQQIDPERKRPLAAAVYHEDSLIFNTQGRVQRINAGDVAEWLKENPMGILILPKEMAERQPGLRLRGEVSGFNYSNGRTVYLSICEVASALPQPEPVPEGVPDGALKSEPASGGKP